MGKEVFRFEFVVADVDRERADFLLRRLEIIVEIYGGRMYGGLVTETAEEEGEDEQ